MNKIQKMSLFLLLFFLPNITGCVQRKDPFYVAIDQLHPTQIRFSQANVDDKIDKAIKQKATDENHSFFAYDNGKSIYGLADAIPVVEAHDGAFYLCDGHHSVLASLAVGAITMPIRVVSSYLYDAETKAFWVWLACRNYAYLKTTDGKTVIPNSFANLIDDPLRYFVALAARKFEKDTTFEHSTGAEYPLWVKLGKDIPFIEFKVADVLALAGFAYAYGEEQNKQLFQEKIEKARTILNKKIGGDSQEATLLKGLKFLPQKEFYKESKQLQSWLKEGF